MNRIFITNRPVTNRYNWQPDLSHALKYGVMEFIFDSDFPSPSRSVASALRRAQAALADFDPAADYLLWPNTGDPGAMWIAQYYLTAIRGVKSFRVLMWNRQKDSKQGYYLPVTIGDGQSTETTDESQGNRR